jgi:hypothetical protein
MDVHDPDPSQQGRGGGARTPVKSVVLSILLPLFIAFPLSTFVFVSQIVALHVFKANLIFGKYMQFPHVRSPATIVYLNKIPADMMIATSVITIILACVSVLGFWELKVNDRNDKGAKYQRRWAVANLIITLSNLIMVIACTIVTFLAGWDVDVKKVRTGKKAVGTREAWVCALEKWNREWALRSEVGCGFARAGRWSLIPLVIFSCALLGLSIWHIGKRGGLGWLRRKGDSNSLPESEKQVDRGKE